ncbi:polysaccharide deacetylase family protein [Leifsonia shinshuensis]|uniref:Polysaccharide deacetylase family protein n=1 Tax=Leifsonia shinshuensis TaxID=150026 RepID=A0A7G6YDX8_9MICO|nr:polysaccharide deacetylase family protein [Leifsonia shinshuensis]QNE36693.1 polysaccharide deacetylase family protein [Leifsonia shinshuensis]
MIINFCFHGIGTPAQERESGESGYWVSERMFLDLLDEVALHPNVRLSFDDGNRSDIEIALPALLDRGLTATFFALAGRLDDPASLDEADLRELRAARMRIGSHGWNHVPWRRLSAADTEREVTEARAALAEASDGPIEEAALPLGRYDRLLLERLERAGYTAIYTSDRFPAKPDSWMQARYSATSASTVAGTRRIFTHTPALRDAWQIASSLAKRVR